MSGNRVRTSTFMLIYQMDSLSDLEVTIEDSFKLNIQFRHLKRTSGVSLGTPSL